MEKFTQDRVSELLRYDPETGKIFWRVTNHNNTRVPGKEVGTVTSDGYRTMTLDGKTNIKLHRIAFALMRVPLPNEVDHINGIKDDNRWCNLRAATQQQNRMNIGPFKNNKSGIRGVYWSKQKKKWCAQSMVAGKQTHLGQFDCIAAAGIAYHLAAVKEFGVFVK